MRLILFTLLAVGLAAPFTPAQTPESKAAEAHPAPAITVSPETRLALRQLIGDVLVNGKAYDYDRQLADTIGPRLTGSPNYTHAVQWALAEFRALGLTNVHTEPFTMPALWEPDTPASGHITEPRLQTLHIYSAGWSPSTPASGIKGHVVYLADVSTAAALNADKDKIPGNIVLLDNGSYGEHTPLGAVVQSWDRIQQLKPLAILLTGSSNGTQNADALTFTGTLATVPVAQVGREDVLLIKRLLDHGPVSVEFSFTNKVRPATQVQNVVADLPGREAPASSNPATSPAPSSIVIVGAHLDSWHPATGAQDNGTGVATALDVARSIKSTGRPPLRTVRFILFGGEEQGLVGSVAYTKAHAADMPTYDAVLISDTGGEPAKGWYLMGREDEKGALANIEPLLAGVGGNRTTSDAQFIFQTDHAGFDVQGVPSLVLWTGVDKYFKLHHQASDSFDSVVEPDLTQGVAVTAATAYAIADAPEPFAPHLNPAQVVDMLKTAKKYDDYEVFKSAGMFP